MGIQKAKGGVVKQMQRVAKMTTETSGQMFHGRLSPLEKLDIAVHAAARDALQNQTSRAVAVQFSASHERSVCFQAVNGVGATTGVADGVPFGAGAGEPNSVCATRSIKNENSSTTGDGIVSPTPAAPSSRFKTHCFLVAPGTVEPTAD